MKKRILILVNSDIVIYNFRRELVEKLIKKNYEVIISSPYGERIGYFVQIGCKFINTKVDRHGKNPITDYKLLRFYKRIIRENKPDVILGYTIKPNIYGSIAARKFGIPFIANITGLGTAVEYKSFLQKITILLYKFAFRQVDTVFFQNTENMQFFVDKKIGLGKHKLIPGSGVNLQYFQVLPYPSDGIIHFAFISRIMKEKGIELYLAAAKYFKEKYPNTIFHVCGFCEQNYEEMLKEYDEKKIIKYHGLVSDVREILKYVHCTVHPTYYPEGMSNILLESAACGRPIISTDRSGCREIIEHGSNGFIVKQNDLVDLINKIEAFIQLDYEKKKQMGLNGRRKVEKEFDRNIVVNAYMREIERLITK